MATQRYRKGLEKEVGQPSLPAQSIKLATYFYLTLESQLDGHLFFNIGLGFNTRITLCKTLIVIYEPPVANIMHFINSGVCDLSSIYGS